jgi:hypothetical protein
VSFLCLVPYSLRIPSPVRYSCSFSCRHVSCMSCVASRGRRASVFFTLFLTRARASSHQLISSMSLSRSLSLPGLSLDSRPMYLNTLGQTPTMKFKLPQFRSSLPCPRASISPIFRCTPTRTTLRQLSRRAAVHVVLRSNLGLPSSF